MQNTTLTEHLAKLALNQPDAGARIEATLALFQKTAENRNVSAEVLLKSLTEKDALNVVVEKFWLEAKKSMLLADGDKSKPQILDVSTENKAVPTKNAAKPKTLPTIGFDECGIWVEESKCKHNPLKGERPANTQTLDASSEPVSDHNKDKDKAPPPQLQKEYQLNY